MTQPLTEQLQALAKRWTEQAAHAAANGGADDIHAGIGRVECADQLLDILIALKKQPAQPALTADEVRTVVRHAITAAALTTSPVDRIVDEAAAKLAGRVADPAQPVITAEDVRSATREACEWAHQQSIALSFEEHVAERLAGHLAGRSVALTPDDRNALLDLKSLVRHAQSRTDDRLWERELALLDRLLAAQPRPAPDPEWAIDVVFDGPPGPTAGRFMEVEDLSGTSVAVGQWINRGNGLWALRIPRAHPAQREAEIERYENELSDLRQRLASATAAGEIVTAERDALRDQREADLREAFLEGWLRGENWVYAGEGVRSVSAPTSTTAESDAAEYARSKAGGS